MTLTQASPQARVARGVPTGGQFSATARAESGLSLVPAPTEAWMRPDGWRDWWPEPVGDGVIDGSAWAAASQEIGWVNAWNATPKDRRRPLELTHGSPQADLRLSGPAHFGDRGTAMDRLYNTLDDVGDGHLHTYEFRGDIVPVVMPDTTANLVLHPHGAFSNEFYDRMAEEVEEMGVDDVEAFVEHAEALYAADPDAAVVYVNNTEGDGDGASASLGIDASSPDLTYVSSRPVTDEDYEYING